MGSWIRLLREVIRDLVRLRPHIRPNRWLVFSVIGTTSLAALFESVGIGLLVPLISMLQMDGAGLENLLRQRSYLRVLPEMFPGRGAGFYVGIFCCVVLLAVVVKNLFFFAGQMVTARFSARIAANLRDSLFSRMQRTSIHVFEERKQGELGSLFSLETIRTQNAVEYLVMLFQRCLLAVFYLSLIIVLSWELTLGIVVLGLSVGGFALYLQLRLRSQGEDRSVAQRDLFGYIAGIFSGMRVVRATHAEDGVLAQFRKLNVRMAEVERRGAVVAGLMTPITEVCAMAGAMALVAWAYAVLIQHKRLENAQLMLVGVLLIRMLPLLNQLYAIMGQIGYTSGGVREALRWLDSPLFPVRPFGDREWKGVSDAIRFEHVGYTYPNGTVALQDVGFTIPAGRTVALVGASGSGKSTVAGLLLRLREPTTGRILVDGVDFWEFSPASWHGRLGMVEQEAFLFHDTVANNIRFGREGVSDADLARAVAAAHLEDVVRSLPAGVETVVGERGSMFSGGQRQRLAIARAVVANPQLLILDEATSALDNVSERQVQEALDAARHQRTVLVIAHRLSTVRSADQIVVMDRGRVAEQGTWDELVARGGLFSRLLESSKAGHLG